MSLVSFSAPNGIGKSRSIYIKESTLEKINQAIDQGFSIIVNSSWKFSGRGYQEHKKLCQTNNHGDGKVKHIVWAVK